tara:strand:+ start:247 stop:2253 length:2007 start_codon:yes stop_codon:yes gene_type:complete
MNTTEIEAQPTNDDINAYLGSQSTTEVEAILDVATDVTSVDALVNYNLTESNFKGVVNVSDVDSELVIDVPEGSEYVGDFMTDLPKNVMFNKVTTGSGMTTLALTNDVKYVIAVPYVNLLLNKEVWCTNNSIDALFVHAKGHSERDVYSFTGNKIMVTYDSLDKVTNILKENRDISEWKLFIDESHTLLQIAGFRHKAVASVLRSYEAYGSYIFGTATPVLDKYKLPRIQEIKKCRLQWSDLQEVKINLMTMSENQNINKAVATILNNHYTNKTEGNAHVFVNSIKMIVQIFKDINKLGVSTKQVRVVCSNNDYNTDTLAKEGIAIATVDSPLRGINFYTSTAFEGCDISDVNGKTYVVVDANREHTAIDIYTTLPQIMGRIRDTKYKNECTLLVDPSNNYFLGAEDFEAKVREHIEGGKAEVNCYNNETSRVFRKRLLAMAITSNYVMYDADTDTLSSNESAHLSDLNNYEAKNNKLYINKNTPNKLIGKQVNNSITTEYINSEVVIDKNLYTKANAKSGKRYSTEELLREYYTDMIEAKGLEDVEAVKAMYSDCEFMANAMKLDVSRIKALGYKKQRIQAELDFTDTRTKNNRELKLLNTLKLKAGKWYSGKVIKAKIQKIYNQQGIYAKASIDHLSDIYELKDLTRAVKGVRVRGIMVSAIKLKV